MQLDNLNFEGGEKIWISISGLKDEHRIPGRNARRRRMISGMRVRGALYERIMSKRRPAEQKHTHT